MLEKNIGDSVNRRFGDLKLRLGTELHGIWDIYVVKRKKGLIFYPIWFMEFEEVMKERQRLKMTNLFELVGVEVAFEELVDREMDNPKRKGCFAKKEWLDTFFNPNIASKEFQKVKADVEKESKWLSGGPRPNIS